MRLCNFCQFKIAFIVASIASDDHHEVEAHSEHHEHPEHGCESCEHSHSCESCEREFIHKCNNNEWVNYLLDDAPAEDGLYYGDLEPGVPTYVGYGELNSVILPGQIQITKGLFMFLAQRVQLKTDSANIYYLKKDCHHHKYEWVNSTGTSIVPFALEPKEASANGFPTYIAKISIDGKVYFGFVGLPGGYMIYYDEFGKPRRSADYEVLTCKSKVCK